MQTEHPPIYEASSLATTAWCLSSPTQTRKEWNQGELSNDTVHFLGVTIQFYLAVGHLAV